jgi:hypothetical protein
MPTAKRFAENLNIFRPLHTHWSFEWGTDLHDYANRPDFDHSSTIKQQYVPNSTINMETDFFCNSNISKNVSPP